MRFAEHHITDDCDHTIIRVFHSAVQAGRRGYREHHHTECELSLLLRGTGVYAVGDKQYAFRAGDAFLFGSNEAHCITEVKTDMELLNFQFEPRILWEHAENAGLLSLFTARSRRFSNLIAREDPVLNPMLRELEQEILQKPACYAVRAKYLLFSALIHVIRTYDYVTAPTVPTPHTAVAGSLTRAIHHINENLEGRLTLREIAEVACMTPSYFSSVFKKFNGLSPWEYITIKRVERAVEMLRSTDMTKLEIAQRCGFSSSSNFYKAFFNVTGKRPSDFA